MPVNQAKRVWLADEVLSPEKLKARLKERAKAARKKERGQKLALGLPPVALAVLCECFINYLRTLTAICGLQTTCLQHQHAHYNHQGPFSSV